MTISTLRTVPSIVLVTLVMVSPRLVSAGADESTSTAVVSMPSEPVEARAGAVVTPFLIAIGELLERTKLAERPQLPAVEAVLAQAVELERELDRQAVAVSDDYRSELQELTGLVQSVDLNAQGDAAVRALELVGRDLRIKTRYLQATAGGFAFRKSLEVVVSVHTLRGPGYRVSFNPLRFVGEQPPRFPVASVTNFAKRALPPGLYVMTLERDGHSFTQPVEIGESGAEEQLIQVGP